MTTGAKALLSNMAKAYKETGQSEFDSVFYQGFPKHVVDELEALGFIVRKNNILASIILTVDGLQETES